MMGNTKKTSIVVHEDIDNLLRRIAIMENTSKSKLYEQAAREKYGKDEDNG